MCRKMMTVGMLFFLLAVPGLVQGDSAVTRGQYAQLLAPLVSPHLPAYDGRFADVDSNTPGASAMALLDEWCLLPGQDGTYEPTGTVSRREGMAAMVKAWELRCGPLEPPAMATYFSDYWEISPAYRKIADKAVMIGAVPMADQLAPDCPLTLQEAASWLNRVQNAVAVQLRVMGNGPVWDFKQAGESTRRIVPGCALDFFITVNEGPLLTQGRLSVLLAVYEDGRLVKTAVRSYRSDGQDEFMIFHGKLQLPAEVQDCLVKAFVWDSEKNLAPLDRSYVLK